MPHIDIDEHHELVVLQYIYRIILVVRKSRFLLRR